MVGPGQRRLRILRQLAGAAGTGSRTARLCAVAAEVTGVSGAGIMLVAAGAVRGALTSSNELSRRAEQLQVVLGEGPALDAAGTGETVVEADLADPATTRWPSFAPAAVACGVRAAASFPVQIGVARLGALSLYGDRPGRLGDDQYADALMMADVAARTILAAQAEAEVGMIAPELESGADLQLVVHQAAGMVSVQLDGSVADALVRLRAHAFRFDVALADVAAAVVDRTLRFENLDAASGPAPHDPDADGAGPDGHGR